jgi:hypothetical protein
MFVPAFPAALRSLAFHAFIEDGRAGSHPFELHISGPFSQGSVEVSANYSIDEGSAGATINMVHGPMLFVSPGEIVAVLRVLDEPAIERSVRLELLEGHGHAPRQRMVPPG